MCNIAQADKYCVLIRDKKIRTTVLWLYACNPLQRYKQRAAALADA